MKTQGLNLPDNCTLKFHANGITVHASLNIPKELLKYISKGRVYKSEHHLVYFLEKEIPLKYCSSKNIREVYLFLINKAMQNLRERKKEMLTNQILRLKEKELKVNF